MYESLSAVGTEGSQASRGIRTVLNLDQDQAKDETLAANWNDSKTPTVDCTFCGSQIATNHGGDWQVQYLSIYWSANWPTTGANWQIVIIDSELVYC